MDEQSKERSARNEVVASRPPFSWSSETDRLDDLRRDMWLSPEGKMVYCAADEHDLAAAWVVDDLKANNDPSVAGASDKEMETPRFFLESKGFVKVGWGDEVYLGVC